MSREVDRRPATKGGTIVTSARESLLESAAEEVSRDLPGDQRVRIASMDATTGNPAALAMDDAPAEEGNYVSRALAHVQTVGGALGLSPEQPAEVARGPPVVQETSAGARAVHLQQLHHGILVYDATLTVRFAPAASSPRLSADRSGRRGPSGPPHARRRGRGAASRRYSCRTDEDEEEHARPLRPAASRTSSRRYLRLRAAAGGRLPSTSPMPTVLEPGPFGADSRPA